MTTRALYELAQLLESVDDAERRLERALLLISALVPYDHCALLQVVPGSDPRFVVAPEASAELRSTLFEAVREMFGTLVDASPRAVALAARPSGVHLAVPLVGLDRVIGVLYVRSQNATYDDEHLRALSVIAAMLAAYLTTLDAQAELVALARERDAACRAAEAAGRAKDEFLELVTHELKSPLNTCRAWLQLVRASADDVARRHALDELEAEVAAGAKVVDGILELAFVASAELRLHLQRTDPVTLIEAAIAGVRSEAEAKSVDLVPLIDDKSPVSPVLFIDRDRISQVVGVLLANAIRFAPAGSRVDVRLSRAGGSARIEVTGTGRGFRRDVLPHVFERFPAAPVNRDDGALDVGLAVVKSIVELHGGRVRADSEGPEHGATFIVELPFATRDKAPSPPLSRGVLAGVRLLLVDKDASFRESFQSAVELHGAVVTVVADGAAVLAEIERGWPDVLLCGDLTDGPESARDLMRAVAVKVCPLPIASISAWRVDEAETASVLGDGVRKWLPKPVQMHSLIEAISELAGRRRPLP